MKNVRVYATAVTAVALVALAPSAGSAQSEHPASHAEVAKALTLGTWSGEMKQVDGTPMPVSIKVGRTDAGLTMELTMIEVGMTRPLSNVVLEGNKLTFNIAPPLPCALERKPDGSFQGTCTENGGDNSTIPIRMIPPVVK